MVIKVLIHQVFEIMNIKNLKFKIIQISKLYINNFTKSNLSNHF